MKYKCQEMEPTFSVMLRDTVPTQQFIFFFLFYCVSELCPDEKESTE